MRRDTAGPEAGREVGRLRGADAARLLVLVAAALTLVGCGLMRPRPLDVAPGQHAVLGRVDMTLFDAREILLDIVREDGAFTHELYVGFGPSDFAIALPPGRYRVTRVRQIDQRQALLDTDARPVRVTFVVGPEPAVYLGTLRLIAARGEPIRVAVADEYATTVPTLRARYSNIPAEVARSLFQPA